MAYTGLSRAWRSRVERMETNKMLTQSCRAMKVGAKKFAAKRTADYGLFCQSGVGKWVVPGITTRCFCSEARGEGNTAL